MRITVIKTDKESSERCITRFNKRVQASRKLLVLRSKRYHARPATKARTRNAAVIREGHRSNREKTRFY